MALSQAELSAELMKIQRCVEEDYARLHDGVSTSILDELMQCGLDRADLGLIGSERTLARRRAEGVLSLEESDRALALARVTRLAVQVFGDTWRAQSWLHDPKQFLAGETPLNAARTIAGSELVRDRLIAIEHGMF